MENVGQESISGMRNMYRGQQDFKAHIWPTEEDTSMELGLASDKACAFVGSVPSA